VIGWVYTCRSNGCIPQQLRSEARIPIPEGNCCLWVLEIRTPTHHTELASQSTIVFR
jgi:hypothetical protein